jgi:amino acid permease
MSNNATDVNITSKNLFVLVAFHTFGPPGKTAVELCIIGFLMGTCIAFFVVVGDLGPALVAKTLNINNTSSLREIVLIGMLLLQCCSYSSLLGSVCIHE